MLASVGVAARDPFQYGDILTRPFGTRIFNLTVVLQGHTVGNTWSTPVTACILWCRIYYNLRDTV